MRALRETRQQVSAHELKLTKFARALKDAADMAGAFTTTGLAISPDDATAVLSLVPTGDEVLQLIRDIDSLRLKANGLQLRLDRLT